jgi:hypothetical protein
MPLPPFPVIPSPRTWSPEDPILTSYLRADPGNAINLLVNPPLFSGSQTTTGTSVPNGTTTPLPLDTELVDTWAAHQIPNAVVTAMLEGWYLCEGFAQIQVTSTAARAIAGVEYTQNGVVSDVYGASTSAQGTTSQAPTPGVADLVLLNAFTTSYSFTAVPASSQFTAPASAYSNGTPVVLSGTTLPGGFSPGLVYYVVAASGSHFQLSSAAGGSPVTVTSAGSGIVQATDTVSLTATQSGAGANYNLKYGYLTTQWVATPSGLAISNPVAPAPWPPAAGIFLVTGCAAGAVSIQVSSTAGMVVGGTLGLDAGSPVAEQVVITGISGTTISVTPTAYPHLPNAPVAVPVSAAWMNQQVRDQIEFLTYPPMARLNNNGSSQSLSSTSFPGVSAAINWVQGASLVGANAWLDNFGGWSSSNPSRYTFQLGGIYYLYGQVFVNGSSSAFSVSAGLRINGGTAQWGDVVPGAGAGGAMCATVRHHLRVNAGDYVEVVGTQNLGSTLSLQSGAPQLCRFVALWRGF